MKHFEGKHKKEVHQNPNPKYSKKNPTNTKQCFKKKKKNWKCHKWMMCWSWAMELFDLVGWWATWSFQHMGMREREKPMVGCYVYRYHTCIINWMSLVKGEIVLDRKPVQKSDYYYYILKKKKKKTQLAAAPRGSKLSANPSGGLGIAAQITFSKSHRSRSLGHWVRTFNFLLLIPFSSTIGLKSSICVSSRFHLYKKSISSRFDFSCTNFQSLVTVAPLEMWFPYFLHW